MIIYFTPLKTEEFDMHVRVDNYVGFNVDTDAVYFGTIKKGGSGRRNITIESGETAKKIIITTDGELSKWVVVSKNNFFIDANKTKDITLMVEVPEDIEYGNYTGKVKLIFMNWFYI